MHTLSNQLPRPGKQLSNLFSGDADFLLIGFSPDLHTPLSLLMSLTVVGLSFGLSFTETAIVSSLSVKSKCMCRS